jgi:ribose transport system permease protein
MALSKAPRRQTDTTEASMTPQAANPPVELQALPRPRRTSRWIGRYGLLVAWAGVIGAFSLALPETFPTVLTLQTVLGSQAILLTLTMALLLSLRVGEFDMSVAGVMGLSLVLVGYLNVVRGWPIGPTVAVALCAGLAVGLTNSLFVVWIGVDSLIVTLGMGTLLVGVAFGINYEITSGIDPRLTKIVATSVAGLPMLFYYAFVLTLLVWYLFSYTPLGRYMYIVGANREVARLSGLRSDAIRVGSLLATSLVSAAAGVMLAGQLGSAAPGTSQAFLLPAFAAAFLGATVIEPGRFNPIGSLIAVYFLVTGISGLNQLGMSGWIEQVFYGGSLVLAVAFSRLISKLA